MLAPVGFTISFAPERTTFCRTEVADRTDAPGKDTDLAIAQKMVYALREGPLFEAELAARIGAKLDTVRRTWQRQKNLFVALPDRRIALVGIDPV